MKRILFIAIIALHSLTAASSDYDYGMSFGNSIEQALYIKLLQSHGIDSKLERGSVGMLWVVPDPEKRAQAETLSKDFLEQRAEAFFRANR